MIFIFQLDTGSGNQFDTGFSSPAINVIQVNEGVWLHLPTHADLPAWNPPRLGE